jgi:hypothetical protein
MIIPSPSLNDLLIIDDEDNLPIKYELTEWKLLSDFRGVVLRETKIPLK